MRFADIPGQNNLKEELILSVRNKKLSHSIMLAGPEGYGGLSLAIALSAYLNCENPKENDSCGECASCHKADKMIHPDIHYTFSTFSDSSGKQILSEKLLPKWRQAVEENPYMTDYEWLTYAGSGNKQGNIYIADCHQIIKNLSLTAYENKAKIQIIWQAQNLGANANSLLKVIEEPSPNTYFIFLTPSTERILPTILSRTRIYAVGPISPEDIMKELKKRSDNEEIIREIAWHSNGDMNRAIKMLENRTDGQMLFEKLRNWLNQSYLMNRLEIYKIVQNLSEMNREQAKDFLNYVLEMIRESIIYKYSLKVRSLITPEEEKFIRNFGNMLNEKNIEFLINEINQAVYQIERNANNKFVFFHLSLQFYRLLARDNRI